MNSKQRKKIEETLPYNCSTPKNYVKWYVLLTRVNKGIKYGAIILDRIRKNIIKREDVNNFTHEHHSAVTVAIPVLYKVSPICVHENILDSLIHTEVKEMETPESSLPGYIFLLPLNVTNFFETFKEKDDTQIKIDSIFVFPSSLKESYFHVVFTSEDKIYFRCYYWNKVNDWSDLLNPRIETEVLFERLVKNLILIYTYETKQITEEQVKETTPGKGFTKNKEDDKEDISLPIRWLGKTFVRQQTKYINVTNRSENNNRTVASHWRRGHWHAVCYGPKRKQRKQQWFKPVFVKTNTD
jgi:hypothetical protein